MQLYKMTMKEGVHFNGRRFVTAIPQLPVWLLIKLHAPFTWMALIYSVSFAAFHVLFSFLALSKLKNEKVAFLIIACYIGFNHHVFFIPASQITLGVTLCLFTISWLEKGLTSVLHYVLFYALFFLQLSAHPLMVAITFFVWGIHLLHHRHGIWKRFIPHLIVFVILSSMLYWIMPSFYDSGKMNQVNFNVLQSLPLTHNLRYFTAQWVWYNLPMIVIALWAIIWVKRKEIGAVLFALGCMIGVFVLSYITFTDITPPHYYEIQLFPFSFMILYVCAVYTKKYAVPILSVISILGFVVIFYLGTFYQQRTARLLSFVKQMEVGEHGWYYQPKPIDNDRYIMKWAFPYETSLLSNLYLGKTTTIYTLASDVEFIPMYITLVSDRIRYYDQLVSLKTECEADQHPINVELGVKDRGQYSIYGAKLLSLTIHNVSNSMLCAQSTTINYELRNSDQEAITAKQHYQNYLDKDIAVGASYTQDIAIYEGDEPLALLILSFSNDLNTQTVAFPIDK